MLPSAVGSDGSESAELTPGQSSHRCLRVRPRSDGAARRLALLVVQRLNGVKPGGTHRGVHAEDEAHRH